MGEISEFQPQYVGSKIAFLYTKFLSSWLSTIRMITSTWRLYIRLKLSVLRFVPRLAFTSGFCGTSSSWTWVALYVCLCLDLVWITQSLVINIFYYRRVSRSSESRTTLNPCSRPILLKFPENKMVGNAPRGDPIALPSPISPPSSRLFHFPTLHAVAMISLPYSERYPAATRPLF